MATSERWYTDLCCVHGAPVQTKGIYSKLFRVEGGEKKSSNQGWLKTYILHALGASFSLPVDFRTPFVDDLCRDSSLLSNLV